MTLGGLTPDSNVGGWAVGVCRWTNWGRRTYDPTERVLYTSLGPLPERESLLFTGPNKNHGIDREATVPVDDRLCRVSPLDVP